jgi:hypothetical protein
MFYTVNLHHYQEVIFTKKEVCVSGVNNFPHAATYGEQHRSVK